MHIRNHVGLDLTEMVKHIPNKISEKRIFKQPLNLPFLLTDITDGVEKSVPKLIFSNFVEDKEPVIENVIGTIVFKYISSTIGYVGTLLKVGDISNLLKIEEKIIKGMKKDTEFFEFNKTYYLGFLTNDKKIFVYREKTII